MKQQNDSFYCAKCDNWVSSVVRFRDPVLLRDHVELYCHGEKEVRSLHRLDEMRSKEDFIVFTDGKSGF